MKQPYSPSDYLRDRSGILKEINDFLSRNPCHSADDHSGPKRLAAINEEYRNQYR